MPFLHGIETIEIANGIRPIQTVASSIIGLVGTAPDADATAFPLNTPVLVSGPRQAALLDDAGTLKDAYQQIYAEGVNIAVVIRVEEGIDAAASLANVVGDATLQTGIHGLMTAQSLLGVTPRILAAPGFTVNTAPFTAAQPAVQALITVAERLRAVAVVDGPNTTEANALTDVANYGSARLRYVDPAARVFDEVTGTIVTRPASASMAGAMSAVDADPSKGFWWPASNIELKGIVGSARPVGFAMSRTDTESNRLNEAGITTIINRNGWRAWGVRSLSADPVWAFLSVRRTFDMVLQSVDEAMLWAMDRPQSDQLWRDIRDSIQSYGDLLVARGALLGFSVWFDPELNNAASMTAGQWTVDIDMEPPAPLERLSIRAHRNGSYYDELIAAVAATN